VVVGEASLPTRCDMQGVTMPVEHMVARGADRGIRGDRGGEGTAVPSGWDDLDERAADDASGMAGMSGTVHCATCGTALGDDPDDDPTGDAGSPICGECERARNFDVFHRFPPGGR
jgi:hypothetical protein